MFLSFSLLIFGGYEGDVPPHSLHPHPFPLPSRARGKQRNRGKNKEIERKEFSAGEKKKVALIVGGRLIWKR